MFLGTEEEQEAAIREIKELEIPVKRYEEVVYVGGIYLRRELLGEFNKLMQLNEKLEQS